MAVRISGLISGLDTDSIVQELVSAYSTKKDNYVKKQTKLQWTQDAWKSLNTKTYSFYTSKLSNMRFSTNYSKKTTSCSNESKAIVSASNTAVNGTQKLKINQVATTGYLTGGELQVDGKKASYKGSTKLSELGFADSGNISLSVDGKTHTFAVDADTTINNVVTQLKTAGVNASFDETNQRFFISSKSSGAENDFALVGDANGIAAMKALGIYAVSSADTTYYRSLAQTSDDEVTNQALNEYLSQQVKIANATLSQDNTKYNAELTYLKNKDEKDEALLKNIEENEKTLREKMGLGEEEEINLEKDEDGNIIDTRYTSLDESVQKEIDALLEKAETYAKTQEEYDGYNTNLANTDVSVDDRIRELEDLVSANKSKMDANTELTSKTYTNEELANNDELQAMLGDYENAEGYQTLYNKYEGIRQQARDMFTDSTYATLNAVDGSDAVRIEGQDSQIELNGAVFTSSTNNYSINGLTITAMAVTGEDEEISITTETDVDGIYNMVKDFLSSYNELIKEMQTAYNADSAKGYEPLTDDEKEAMSDDEIEKWETKIKDSLLRRDQTLGGVISAMQTAMMQSYTVGGKMYSLSTFGIGTGSYFTTDANERGSLHIDGDVDDEVTSGEEDKLRAAIAADPDTFIEAFSKIAAGLYDTLSKKMATTSMSSAYTIYNDKYMKNQYEDLEDTIEMWEERIEDYEDKYYKQFSAMETALSSLNSQSTSLANLLGS